MNRAIIFLNTDKSDFSRLGRYLDKDALLIGCDGGAKNILELGLKPDVIIGDFDSFNKKMLKDEKVIELPKDKDYTDSEAAIKYAIKHGAEEIIIAGLLGSRTDHLLGNVFLLGKSDFAGHNIKIIDGRQEAYLIMRKAAIRGKKGDIISFVPIFGDVKALSSSGLKYPLQNYILSMQENTGISNEFIADSISISLKRSDKLLVVHDAV